MCDLTGLILYHYQWIDLNEIMVCMADVHDEAVPVSNELAQTSDGEDGGSASDDLPDMSAPTNQGAPSSQGSSCAGYPWEPWPHMPPPAPGAPPRPATTRGHGLLLFEQL